MNGGRCSTTRIWRPPSSTASWSADGSFASMDPRDELVISSWRTPCQAVPNGSEYLEYVAQNFRNPQLEILKVEMNLLQTRFDKFDDLIFRMRGWLFTIVATLLGGAISLKKVQLATLATGMPILFYLFESFWRLDWFKYVLRYRHIRDALHTNKSIEDFAPYDLTDKYGNAPGWRRGLSNTLWSLERFVFFASLALCSLVVRRLV